LRALSFLLRTKRNSKTKEIRIELQSQNQPNATSQQHSMILTKITQISVTNDSISFSFRLIENDEPSYTINPKWNATLKVLRLPLALHDDHRTNSTRKRSCWGAGGRTMIWYWGQWWIRKQVYVFGTVGMTSPVWQTWGSRIKKFQRFLTSKK